MSRVLILGERRNADPPNRQRQREDVDDRYWRLMSRFRAFPDESSRRRFRSIGVDLADEEEFWAMNLLMPAPQRVPWDADLAARIAKDWSTRIVSVGYEIVAMCGVRVAQAFGVKSRLVDTIGEPFDVAGFRAVLLPHPSGLNRWWNSSDNIVDLKKRLERLW